MSQSSLIKRRMLENAIFSVKKIGIPISWIEQYYPFVVIKMYDHRTKELCLCFPRLEKEIPLLMIYELSPSSASFSGPYLPFRDVCYVGGMGTVLLLNWKDMEQAKLLQEKIERSPAYEASSIPDLPNNFKDSLVALIFGVVVQHTKLLM